MNLKLKVMIVLVFLIFITSLLSVGCGPQPRAIIGKIIYSGMQIGKVRVIAARPGKESIRSRYVIAMDNLGPYDLHVSTGTYTVSAYLDADYDGNQDPNEPSGYYDDDGDGKADEIVVRGEVTGIDITLHDP